MKIIELTELFNRKIYMNIDNISVIEKYENAGGHSLIRMDRTEFHVKETPEEIVAMIHEVEGNKWFF